VDRFPGPSFHSAQWDHDLDLRGKRVAVIGTGASAIQFVPHIRRQASRVTVFQRSAPWIVPKPDTGYGKARQWLFRRIPPTLAAERLYFWVVGEVAAFGLAGNEAVATGVRWFADRLRRKQITDPALRAKVTPDYHIGCKRVLFSNDYLPALAASNVDLITESVEEITETGVGTVDGSHIDADVIIYGTGFAATDFLAPMRITGADGAELTDAWRGGARAYLGISVPGFPNMFCMYGPNTNLGSGSIVYMLERQARYIRQAVEFLARNPETPLSARTEVEHDYDIEIQERLRASVWSRCQSWYRLQGGRVPTNWPGTVSEYSRRTRKFDLSAYDVNAKVSK
jgi:cation diffusion facilitator CzcD-associated flavoprotein CzcO